MRTLVVTKIFPNACEPHASPFNRQQFAELRRFCDVEVLATIPWFPLASLAGTRTRANTLRGVPERDRIADIEVSHPRYLYIPKVGDALASALYAASLFSEVRRRRPRIDVILASWAYPDGAAAVMLGELLEIPVVIKLHGSDINVIGERPVVRAHLRRSFPRAAAIVAVSRPLAERAISLGALAEHTHTVANGIDRERFSPRDQTQARRAVGLPERPRVIAFIGRLEREKGVLDLMEAFESVARTNADAILVFVGDGSIRMQLEALARPFGDRVRILGARPHDEIPHYVASADVVTLPSWAEGTPNAVLEALASGRRVVATRVGGIPDVVRCDTLGALVAPRSPAALADALRAALARDYDPEEIAATAAVRSWTESAREVFDVLSDVTARGPSRPARR